MSLQLTQKGYEEYLAEIAEKEEELRQIGIYKGREAVEHGDVWHDNHSFEQAEIQERALIRTISDLKAKIQDIEIVEDIIKDSSIVNIGSEVEVELSFSEQQNDTERLTVIISGDYNNKKNDSYISINSPLAKAIMGKEVGFSGYYEVNASKIKVTVLSII